MSGIILNLEQLIQYTNFQQLQDKLSDFLGVSIVTLDYKGTPVVQQSHIEKCSSSLRNYSNMPLAFAGIEAAREREPYVFLCHKRLVDVAIPLFANDVYIGTVMLGQIILKDENETTKIANRCFSNHLSEYDIFEIENMPVMTLSQIIIVSKIVFFFLNEGIETAMSQIYNPNIKTYYNTPSTHKKNYQAHKNLAVLQPALSFIKNNFEREITLDQVAELCDVTPSYFSKLFKKAIGANLVTYLNKLRIEKSKVLLLSTTEKIEDIAKQVGFVDPSYFIKVFKKYEKKTPSYYRKQKGF